MSIADPLRLAWLNGINKPVGKKIDNMDKLFEIKNITTTTALVSNQIKIHIGNSQKTINFFAHDTDRFATAAFESMIAESPKPEFPRSTAWLLIRGYYSAFFAMHALMRIQGVACLRVSKNITNIINKQLAYLFPDSPLLEAGFYLIQSNNSGAELTLNKLDLSATGSHEALWSQLNDQMNSISTIALRDTVDPDAGRELALLIGSLTSLLQKKGGPTWLSQIRNRINYLHAYGTWSPYNTSTNDVARLTSRFEKWKTGEDLMTSVPLDELSEFVEACSFILYLCKATIKDLAYRSNANSPIKLSSGRLLASL